MKPNPEEISAAIAELENWNRVRARLNSRPDRRKALDMDTLPRAIAMLRQYRESV